MFLEAVGDYGLQRKGLTRKCRRMRFKSYMDQEINKEIEIIRIKKEAQKSFFFDAKRQVEVDEKRRK